MNRRGFLRAALAGIVGACVRWLPMPAAPTLVAEPMTLLELARVVDPDVPDIFADIFGQPSPLIQLMDFGPDDSEAST